MIRLSWTVFWLTALAASLFAPQWMTKPTAAQQPATTSRVPSYAQQEASGSNPQATNPDAQIASRVQQPTDATASQQTAAQQPVQPQQPFAPLTPAQEAQLNQLLLAWQEHSQSTTTLDCRFQRWHYDSQAAPAGVHATHSEGVIKYAAPDKGLFRVDSLVFYKSIEGGQPKFEPQEGLFGEHWVCNGTQLIEFDRSQKQCKIQDLPPEMQGQQIFNSPLPFVFNLNAEEIKQRYWVRQVAPPDAIADTCVMIEAWPKRQDDRAQYKMVAIVLEKQTFLPRALCMYAPNFSVPSTINFDQYEFIDMKRNSVGNAISNFMKNFITDRAPSDWTVFRDKFTPYVEPPTQQAAQSATIKR